jgi:F-type H+-transporting ATPase subunit delta
MQNPRLAGRYAKSLMDIAVEQNVVDALNEDAKGLSAMFKASADFTNFVKSPVIKADKKNAIFKELIGGKVNAITEKFITLVVNKSREAALPEIMESYIDMHKQRNNVTTVKLTTAHELNDAEKAAITDKITAQLQGAKIDLQVTVNEKLIGGFVLEANNKLFDASVARDLRDIKKQFLQNIYVPNIR